MNSELEKLRGVERQWDNIDSMHRVTSHLLPLPLIALPSLSIDAFSLWSTPLTSLEGRIKLRRPAQRTLHPHRNGEEREREFKTGAVGDAWETVKGCNREGGSFCFIWWFIFFVHVPSSSPLFHPLLPLLPLCSPLSPTVALSSWFQRLLSENYKLKLQLEENGLSFSHLLPARSSSSFKPISSSNPSTSSSYKEFSRLFASSDLNTLTSTSSSSSSFENSLAEQEGMKTSSRTTSKKTSSSVLEEEEGLTLYVYSLISTLLRLSMVRLERANRARERRARSRSRGALFVSNKENPSQHLWRREEIPIGVRRRKGGRFDQRGGTFVTSPRHDDRDKWEQWGS